MNRNIALLLSEQRGIDLLTLTGIDTVSLGKLACPGKPFVRIRRSVWPTAVSLAEIPCPNLPSSPKVRTSGANPGWDCFASPSLEIASTESPPTFNPAIRCGMFKRDFCADCLSAKVILRASLADRTELNVAELLLS